MLLDTLFTLHLNSMTPYLYDDVNNNGPAGKDTEIDTVHVYHAHLFNFLLKSFTFIVMLLCTVQYINYACFVAGIVTRIQFVLVIALGANLKKKYALVCHDGPL